MKRVDSMVELLANVVSPATETREMFGGTCFLAGDAIFAIVWKGRLFFKTLPDGVAAFEERGSTAFCPYKDPRRAIKSFWEVPADVVDDEELLGTWASRAQKAAIAKKKASPSRRRR